MPKQRDRVGQHALGDGADRADAQQAGATTAYGTGAVVQRFKADEGAFDVGVERFGLGRGDDAGADPLKKHEAQGLFKQRDPAADVRLRRVQQARRGGHGAGHHDGPKGLDLFEIHARDQIRKRAFKSYHFCI
ncbi:hypothetical protein D3C72_1560890 [compost metagenome]